jgi:hypothetical protein
MTLHQINGLRIHTSHDYPPIPVRSFDWSAVTDDYDCDCDQDGFFSTNPIGHGATEQEAIEDLLEQMDIEEGCRTRNGHYVGPGPVPEDARFVVGVTCGQCRGAGYVESE